jgi:hypothetical protein
MHAVAPAQSLCLARRRCGAPARAPRALGRRRAQPARAARSEPPGPPERETGAGLKALWYAAEAFGAAVGALKPRTDADAALLAADAAAPLDSAERLASLRADYSVDYFISGRGEMRAYDPECVFADP